MIEVSYVESEGEPGRIARTEERMGGRLSSGVIKAGGMGEVWQEVVGLSHPERGDYGSLPSNLGRVEELSWQEAGGGGSPILRGEVGLPHPIWGGSSGIE